MFNWRAILGAILLIIGALNFYSAYVGKSANTLGVDTTYTKIACIIWIAVGGYLLFRGLKKQ